MSNELRNKLAITLLELPGWGQVSVIKTLNAFFSSIDFLNCDSTDDLISAIKTCEHLKGVAVTASTDEINVAIQSMAQIIHNSKINKIVIVNYWDEAYPQLLKRISNAPPIIYCKGDINKLNMAGVAVVGTRQPTSEGLSQAEWVSKTLISKGIAIISGLALGCDTAAHQACLAHNGSAIAVLAGGLDQISPKSNAALSDKIIEMGGTLLSENPIGHKPQKYDFVNRDRIQSGLSQAVIVVQTGIKGGTMNTVAFARKQKRLVGCLIRSDGKYWGEEALGNDVLLKEGNAISIYNKESLDKFLSEVHVLQIGGIVDSRQNQLF